VKDPSVERLLRDLFSLYLKHGRSAFQKAIAALESGEATELILRTSSSMLEAASVDPGIPTKRGSKRSPRDRFEQFQASLSLGGEGKLTDFLADVAQGRKLTSSKSLRTFASQLSIQTGKKLERFTIAKKIGEVLLSKSAQERERLFAIASDIESRRSSLHEWSKIIVKE
jgi:hypothetical protein